MDSTDIIEDLESLGYIDLDHYVPDIPRLDRIIMTRSLRAQDISSKDREVVVKEITESKAIELFR